MGDEPDQTPRDAMTTNPDLEGNMPEHEPNPNEPQQQATLKLGEPSEPTPSKPAQPDPTAALITELTALKAWKAQKDIEDQQRAEQARMDRQKGLAEKGQIEELVKQHAAEIEEYRRKSQDAVERHKKAELKRELATALANHTLVKGAAEQLSRLWADEFEVIELADSYHVRSKDLKSPADWVKEKLSSEDYSHFVKAEARGGGGTQAGQTRQPTQAVNQPIQQVQGRPVLTPDALSKILAHRTDGQPGYHTGMGLKPVRN